MQCGIRVIVGFALLLCFAYSMLAQGTCTNGGSCNPSSLNNFIYVDGVKYAKTDVGVQAALAAAGAGTVVLGPGSYSFASTVTMNTSGQHLLCSGIGSTVIIYTGGATTAVIDAGTSSTGIPTYNNISINGCTISGNGNVEYDIRTRGVQRSDFSHNSLVNVTTAGIETNFCVGCTLDDLHTSANEQKFTTVPASCIILDGPDSSHQTTVSSVRNPVCEGVSGDGIQVKQAFGIEIGPGTSEGNARGLNVFPTASHITSEDMDYESNSVEDVLNNGSLLLLNSTCTHLHAGATSEATVTVSAGTGGPGACFPSTIDSGAQSVIQYDANAIVMSAASAKVVLDSSVQTLTNKMLSNPIVIGVTPATSSGQLGLGATTATTATAGSHGGVPGQVAGYLVISLNGATYKIPFFNQ